MSSPLRSTTWSAQDYTTACETHIYHANSSSTVLEISHHVRLPSLSWSLLRVLAIGRRLDLPNPHCSIPSSSCNEVV
jgi:hypothetical protein